MSIIKAKRCEIEIQEQTIEDAGAKYMVVLSYEPEGKQSKEIISIVLTDALPGLKQTIDNGDFIVEKNIFNTDGILNKWRGKDEKNLILLNGNIQRLNAEGDVNIVKFEKTSFNLSGISTKSISEPKMQETSTIQILQCIMNKNTLMQNCTENLCDDEVWAFAFTMLGKLTQIMNDHDKLISRNSTITIRRRGLATGPQLMSGRFTLPVSL